MAIDIRKMQKVSEGTTVNPIIPPKQGGEDAPASGIGEVTSSIEVVSDAQLKEYREYLEAKGVSEEDIFAVLDGLITNGEVFWSFELLGKIPVTLRTRPTWVNQELLSELEIQSPKTYMRFANIVSLYNLAGSLQQYGETTYTLVAVDDLDTVYKMINNLPQAIQAKLVEQLATFDRLVVVATSDWAVENFTAPQAAE